MTNLPFPPSDHFRHPNTGKLWEYNVPNLKGGVIFMKCGVTVEKKEIWSEKNDILDNLYRSLTRFHAAGILHTDIRWPNVLKFGDAYELIDLSYGVLFDSVKNTEETKDDELIRMVRSLNISYNQRNDDDDDGDVDEIQNENLFQFRDYFPGGMIGLVEGARLDNSPPAVKQAMMDGHDCYRWTTSDDTYMLLNLYVQLQ